MIDASVFSLTTMHRNLTNNPYELVERIRLMSQIKTRSAILREQ